jgi:putative ATP-dependent endonuclease of OLD family
MNIELSRVHIRNYRSLRDVDIDLCKFSVLFGKNDSGKSNFLYALGLAFGNGSIETSDVFASLANPPNPEKTVIIDVQFLPMDDKFDRTNTFNELWGLHLGDNISIDLNDQEFFAFRTEFVFDYEREEYIRERKVITNWNENSVILGKSLGSRTLAAFEYIFLDAQRDIASDIRDKKSRWSKEISKIKLSADARAEIEDSLATLSGKILSESPLLLQAQNDLSAATNIGNSEIEISPITRTINELYKGLDIYVKQGEGYSLPVSSYGAGTRSRAVFAVLKTLVNARLRSATDTPYYCVVAFEEPEAHIHPQAQKQLVNDFSKIEAQRIITTHSPYLLSSTKIEDLVYVAIKNAETKCTALSGLSLEPNDRRQIERFVLNTRGDLLFSSLTILVEGETEEQALTIFFKEYFSQEPFELGVSIIGVGGKNYFPFLRVLKAIGAKWVIFSDGEPAAIKDVKSVIKKLTGTTMEPDLSKYPNIIILDNANDFETYLLDNGYIDEIILAINEFENNEKPETYFDQYKSLHDGTELSPKSTDKNCELCGQSIKEAPLRDYHSEGGQKRALQDCMKGGKAKYAASISRTICKVCDEDRKFPPQIKTLLERIVVELGLAQ